MNSTVQFNIVDIFIYMISSQWGLLMASGRVVSISLIIAFLFLVFVALSISDDASAQNDTYRIEWIYIEEDLTSPSEPVAPLGAIFPAPVRSINPYEEQSFVIILGIKNYGTKGTNITIEGFSQDENITVKVTPSNPFIMSDQMTFTNIIIKVTKEIIPGNHIVSVNASSVDALFVPRVVPFEINIFYIDVQVPPIPTLLDPILGDVVQSSIEIQLGSDLSFSLTIKNNGTIDLEGVPVRIIDKYEVEDIPVENIILNFFTPRINIGEEYIVGRQPFTDKEPALIWSANVTGRHTLVFRVGYDHQFFTSNDESIITVIVKQPPEIISIEPPTGKSFLVGENITFRANATDMDGDNLTFTWMEGSIILGTGLEINHSSFLPGQHTITLVVDDGMSSVSQDIIIIVEDDSDKRDDFGLTTLIVILAMIIIIVIIILYRYGIRSSIKIE